jgi:hypothetical protein
LIGYEKFSAISVEAKSKINLIERFQVLTAVSMKMSAFWVVEPCRVVYVY